MKAGGLKDPDRRLHHVGSYFLCTTSPLEASEPVIPVAVDTLNPRSYISRYTPVDPFRGPYNPKPLNPKPLPTSAMRPLMYQGISRQWPSCPRARPWAAMGLALEA